MDFETIAPIIGTATGGFVVWALKRVFTSLIAASKARKSTQVEASSGNDASEGRILAERAGDLFDDQRTFGRDLQAAVQRLSNSVDKRDRRIARLERQLIAEKRRSFSLELRIKQAQLDLDELHKRYPDTTDGYQSG